MSRIAFFLLGGLGLALSPAVARAQFAPALVPPNSLYSLPPYGYQFNLGTSVPTAFGRTFVGVTDPFTAAPQLFSPQYGQSYYGSGYYGSNSGARPPWMSGGMTSSGYLTGGSYVGSGYSSQSSQRDLAAAQAAATATRMRRSQDDAKELIDAQWAYERLGVKGQVAVQSALTQTAELQKALAVKDETEVASGAALNRILVAIVVAEGKGGKGVAAFLPPQLLDEVRFTGGPLAELLNLIRQSGKVPFPTAFATPALVDHRDALERDFTAAIAPLLTGKPVDPMKVMKLENTLKKVEAVAPPIIRNLPLDDAIAARRFLNQIDKVIVALRGSGINGLVNAKWATEGTNVADLVKHFTKFKLMFGAAPAGSQSSYLALHRAMATYLFVLSQPKK